MNMHKLELEAPGFTRVYESVRRLATFHKIEQADCQGTALVATLEHPNSIQAALRAARRALNDERRQRLPARQIDGRTDDDEGVEAAEADRRTLPGEFDLINLNDEGEYYDHGDQDHEDQPTGDQVPDPTEDRACDLPHDLPVIVPRDLITAIIFWAGQGKDVEQIAELVGRTEARIHQILRDPKAIRRAIARAIANPALPGLGLESYLPTAREKIKHKPRGAHPIMEDEDQESDQVLLPLF
jgi:hypothetical protein